MNRKVTLTVKELKDAGKMIEKAILDFIMKNADGPEKLAHLDIRSLTGIGIKYRKKFSKNNLLSNPEELICINFKPLHTLP